LPLAFQTADIQCLYHEPTEGDSKQFIPTGMAALLFFMSIGMKAEKRRQWAVASVV
jgi:hypothetical protein